MKVDKDKGIKTMNALIAMNNKEPETMNAIAAELADIAGIDDMSTWTPATVLQRLRDAKNQIQTDIVKRKINLAGIDYENLKTVFLKNAGGSDHTRRGYSNAIKRLDAWTASQNINPLELTPPQADDFIYFLRNEKSDKTGETISPGTVRITAAAVSSFYTFIHRRHTAIDNPFRGSKARPKEKQVRKLNVPNATELKIIIKALPPMEAAAVSIMAGLGLRAGALPTLEKEGDRKYKGMSKGKAIHKTFTPDMIKRITAAELSLRAPFTKMTANSIELRINYHIKKLFTVGEISGAFSCHDLRHHAAIREYKKDRDIKRVKDFLDHSSISITERYLRSLGEA